MHTEQRTTGLDTNFSALHTTRTLNSMRPSSNTPNWVSFLNAVFEISFVMDHSFRFPTLPLGLLGLQFRACELVVFSQVSLCGDATMGCLDLPIVCSAPRACTCFHLWRCFVNGNCRKIAAILHRSCTGSTPKRSWSRTNWGGLFYT